jgi:hypothetical protein
MIVPNMPDPHTWLNIEVARRTFLCPPPQPIPIMAHLLLIMSSISLAPGMQQCIVNVAHNVLPQRIETMEIVAM